MAINRTETFYPRNDTTIDTGTGIDVRILSTTQSGTNDVTQTCTAQDTADNANRWFDPATTGNTDTTDSNTTLVKRGWALRLSEDMTPADDTNCDAMLPANTTTVTIDVAVAWASTILATPNPTFKASLWRYNPSSDSGTLIAAGSTAQTWNNLTENGNFKSIAISISVPQTTFSTGEVLMVQIGLNTGTLPNMTPSNSYTFTLRINNATTRVAFASGSHILQLCSFTNALNGVGTATKDPLPINVTADVSGVGAVTHSRLSTISKTFSLNGVGTPTYSKFTTAYRTFDLSARGEILTSGSNASTVAIPIDEIPTGSGSGPTYIFPVLD